MKGIPKPLAGTGSSATNIYIKGCGNCRKFLLPPSTILTLVKTNTSYSISQQHIFMNSKIRLTFFCFCFFCFQITWISIFFRKICSNILFKSKTFVKKTLIQRDKQFQEDYDFCANCCQEDPKVSKLSRSFFSLVPMVPFYRFYLSTQLTLPSKSLTLSSKSTIETVEKGVKYVLSLQ